MIQADNDKDEDSLCISAVAQDRPIKNGLELLLDFFPNGTEIETVYNDGSKSYFFKHKL